MEADIDSDVDALTVAKAGVPAVQLHTGGMCHLDADMSRQGMAALEAEADNTLDFIILENVGNLVCPAEFDTGACLNVAILSVPEGDDKPLKYPLMFENRSLQIMSYNLETLLAEKLETIMYRGTSNTRMRDLYDIYMLWIGLRIILQ